eukprot:COSAG01_NODE_10939_length_2043_cov_2.770576_1_plen_385_part_00
MYAILLALDAIVASGGNVNDAASLMHALKSVSFEGASGNVSFDSNIDRTCAGRDCYLLVAQSFNANASVLTHVGRWDAAGDKFVYNFQRPLRELVAPRMPLSRRCSEGTDSEGLEKAALVAVVGAAVVICLSGIYVVVVCPYRRRAKARKEEQERCAADAELRRQQQRASHYTAFISHSKHDAGETAAIIQEKLQAMLVDNQGPAHTRGKVFIDTELLTDINAGALIQAVKKSETFVLLLTKEVLTRPWCVLEIYTALDSNVPIVPVLVCQREQSDTYSYREAANLLNNLDQLFDEKYMREKWGVDPWRRDIDWQGVGAAATLDDLKRVLPKLLDCKAEEFQPTTKQLIREAQLQEIVNQIEDRLRDTEKHRRANPNIAWGPIL